MFLALQRAGSFAGAGRILGVNATTTARRLESLEQEMGARLFTRTPDGLVPTAAAEAMLEPSELIERQAQLIERSIAGEDVRLAGSVSLAISQAFAFAFVIEHLASFRRSHPDISLELHTADALVDLSRGEADIAVRPRLPGAGPGVVEERIEIVTRRIGAAGMAVWASRSYLEEAGCPPSALELEGHRIVAPLEQASHLPGSAWAHAAAESGVQVAMRCGSILAIAGAGEAGYGLVALPTFVALRYPDLIRISPPDILESVDIWMLMPGDLRRVARVRALWEFLIEIFATWDPLMSGRVIPEGRDTSSWADA